MLCSSKLNSIKIIKNIVKVIKSIKFLVKVAISQLLG